MENNGKKFLHLGVWNIEGLTNKLDNPDFISKIKDFDLISLVETWLPYGNQKINIDGYYSFSKHRKQKAQNARRNSGGITILVKSSVKKGIKFLDRESNEEFVWWKLEKSFLKPNSDIFICSAYVPPQNSSREIRIDIDHYDHLQNNIYKFLNQGKVLLCGDFNARTGT